jgi:hypothetical protein
MEIDAVTDVSDRAFSPVSTIEQSEWNGKDVQTLPPARAWLVLQIPIQTPNPLPNLGQRVTTVNSKTVPTVETVLASHGLEFDSRLVDKEIKQLPTSDYQWVVIPLPTSEIPASLQERVYIDTNPHRNVERVLQQQGIGIEAPPFFSPHNLV